MFAARPPRRRHLLRVLLLPAAAAAFVSMAGPATARVDATIEPPADLDPRIDGSRITDLPPAGLPESIILPLPPDHRVAELAAAVPLPAAEFTAAREAIERGLDALVAMQAEDGSWAPSATAVPSDNPDRRASVTLAVTAMAVRALAQSSEHAAHPDALERGLAVLLDARRPDGSFAEGPLANYVNSVVISALAALDDPTRRPLMEQAVRVLSDAQWDEGEGLEPSRDWYGGAGYGRSGRPDLSNTQMMLEALYDAGVSPDEPAVQRALAFVTRTQNLSATNPADWAGDDGGFAYTPANGGESMASEVAGEGRRGERIPAGDPRRLRSYGSMSYAGFKSLLYAGLSSDDPRVVAVFGWIRRNYTFDENPGMGLQGLYYYGHAAARALRVAQQVRIPLTDGSSRNWRSDLIAAVLGRQNADGSWANEHPRWIEDEPALATTYAVLTLQETLKPVTFPRPEADESSGADTDG